MSDTKKKKTSIPANTEPVVYCGPSVREIGAQYTTFIGGIPSTLQSVVDRYPMVQSLIVPVEKLSETRAALRDQTCGLGMLYAKVCDILTKGGK